MISCRTYEVRDIDSKPYNNTGMHLEITSCSITSSDAARPTLPRIAFTDRKKTISYAYAKRLSIETEQYKCPNSE